jgi:MerR family transcriptional regulator, redox-sensitive transcriptional activator SoxR
MPLLTISEVARQIGLRPSAIRYYEQIGILPPAHRINGQRRYDLSVLYRLIVIQRARHTGFTLPEIKQLFYGFRAGTLPSARWQKLKTQKMVELDRMLEHIQAMRELVQQHGICGCRALEECGKKMFEERCANGSRTLITKPTRLPGVVPLVRPKDGTYRK